MGLVTDLDLAGLTEATLDGDGVFDVLMRATKAHLKEEFDKGRIKGSDYANVYVSSLNTVLAQSVQFYSQSEIGKKQIEQTQAQIDLLAQKLQTEKAQTEGTLTKTGNVWDLLPEEDSGYVGGTLGRQMILHATQADGFLRDAEQKAANKLIDTWNIRRSTDTGTVPSTEAHLTDNDIGKFIEKMASGINMTL